MGTWSFPVVD